jgi:hypothetical protein
LVSGFWFLVSGFWFLSEELRFIKRPYRPLAIFFKIGQGAKGHQVAQHGMDGRHLTGRLAPWEWGGGQDDDLGKIYIFTLRLLQ